ncbi:major facilitator superfamily transporter [Venturia nashicola]|uniref:Major facilitator superfamily transporter n=1 Tax=Venturia nashicola TaxID=86259 RepID=A0A4Z1NFZ4_9PEZI|nr:major facilitator superfamily transporter [Venturia nashicola]TLD18727.1 major facilitator superfamily transporter [Venturia nashicola]
MVEKQKDGDTKNEADVSLERPNVDYAGASEKTDPEEIKLVRKMDLIFLPILWMLCFMNYLNRQAVTVARLDGLEKTLKMKGTDFSTTIAIHYVGYILAQVPSNMLLTRMRPSLYLPLSMILCALVTGLTALCHDFKSLLLQRFFQGITATPMYPGALYLLSVFYTRKEIGTRMTIIYTNNMVATACTGLIAAPIFSELGGKHGLAGWKWMFMIFSVFSVFFAILGMFFLPNTPLTTRWLTEAQRQMAHDRIVRDTVEKKQDVSMMAGLREAALDYRVWLFAASSHIHTATSGFRNFLPTVIKTFGYGTTVTLVLTCPPYLLSCATGIGMAVSSGKYNERTWHIVVFKLIALAGFVIACATTNVGARYFATFVFCVGTYGITSVVTAWVASTCSQTKEKRAAALAIVNASSSISFIWNPYLWPTSAAPRYILPMAASAGMCFFTIACMLLMKWDLIRENKRIRRDDPTAVLFYAY